MRSYLQIPGVTILTYLSGGFTVTQNKTLCWQISEVIGLLLVLVLALVMTLNNIVKYLFLVSLMFIRVLTINFVRSGIRPLLFPPILFPWHLYFLHHVAKWHQTPLLFPPGYTTTLHFPASLQFAEAVSESDQWRVYATSESGLWNFMCGPPHILFSSLQDGVDNLVEDLETFKWKYRY